MRTIWKYPIEAGAPVEMPVGAVIVAVDADPAGMLCVWAEVESATAMERRWLWVVGTGQEVPPNARYIGHAVMPPYVWHIYEAWRVANG